MILKGDAGEGFLRLRVSGIDAGGVGEALLGRLQVALGLGGTAEPEFDGKAVRVGLGGFLKEVEGIVDLAVVEEQHAVEDSDFGQTVVGLGEIGGDGPGLGDVVIENKNARVGELDGSALGVLGGQVSVVGLGAVELLGADVVVGEELGTGVGVGEVVGGLMEGLLGLGGVVLLEVDVGEGGAHHGVGGVGRFGGQ